MVLKILWWKRKGAGKPKKWVAKPKRKVEKVESRVEMPRRGVARDHASGVIPARRSSSHRFTQSTKPMLDQMVEEFNYNGQDWMTESDFSPPRNDLGNGDLVLRSRTVDSVELARRMACSKALHHTMEDFIEYKAPSFRGCVDDRDDISIDDDTVSESQFSGLLQMVQRLLGDEPIPSPRLAELVEDDMPNEPVKNGFVPPRYIAFTGEEDILFNNERALTVDNANMSSLPLHQNAKNFVVTDFDDDSSTFSWSTSSGTGIITYDGSHDDNDPGIFEAFDEATDSFLQFIKVVKNGLWSRT